jgi:hypothetical protein
VKVELRYPFYFVLAERSGYEVYIYKFLLQIVHDRLSIGRDDENSVGTAGPSGEPEWP